MIKKNYKIILAFILMILSFSINIFSSRSEKIGSTTFADFQSDSEYLVLSKIYSEKYVNHSVYGLTIGYAPDGNRIKDLSSSLNEENPDYHKFNPYNSQLGLQGHIISTMYIYLHIPIGVIKLVLCILLTIIIISICKIIAKRYSKLMGYVFYLTFLLSPWVVAFARNLYWVEFTWFLPALFALKSLENPKKRKLYYSFIFISILIKCLCGYEYVSTIMMFTIAFHLIDFFLAKKKEKKLIAKNIIQIGLICLSAFSLALCIHGYFRGDGNILKGIESIYKRDIARRTLYIPGSEDWETPNFSASINASIYSTVKKYFSWSTSIITGIDGKYFKALIILTVICIIGELINNKKNSKRDLCMFVVFFLTTLSWFVLGKAHSYVHTHMNYVLWYFGFVQICIYIILKNILEFLQNYQLKTLDEKD